MNSYEQKRADRAERLRSRAAKLATEADSRLAADRSKLDAMAGTPVLVGHHSEKRHRRDLEKMQRNTEKAIGAHKESERLKGAAHAAENNTSISSDDPDAIEKLRAKLTEVAYQHAGAKAINKVLRGVKSTEEATAKLNAAALMLSPSALANLSKPDEFGHWGVPAYKLTNLNAEAKRIRARIDELEKRAATPERGQVAIGDVTIEESDNRVRMHLPGKPAAEWIAELKRNGFRWSPSLTAWQRMASSAAWERATSIAKEMSK